MAQYLIDFVAADGSTPAPYFDASGAPVAAAAGSSAVFVTHVRVRVRAVGLGGAEVIRGTLHVQRQHSLEV